jgi:cyclic pyranopterin phosphate synthase
MPEDHYAWLEREKILTFEEIVRLVHSFVKMGVSNLRVTGGEPLLRKDLSKLIREISGTPGIEDIAMTTNAVVLSQYASDLKNAGLGRITVSLDSLDRERYHRFTKNDKLEQVLEGIKGLVDVGFERTKINTVVVRGFNEDELPDLVEFALEHGAEPRFIEYMDVGGATGWSSEKVVPRSEILEILGKRFGELTPDDAARGSAPAERFRLPGGGRVGIVASTTTPFCADCDRARLTADGHLFLCLYSDSGIDVREWVRNGCSDEELDEKLRSIWEQRSDRGAVDRLEAEERSPLYQVGSLRQKPHREMHTRGG